MECRRSDALALFTEYICDTVFQFACCLVCKGYRQNVPRSDRSETYHLCQLCAVIVPALSIISYELCLLRCELLLIACFIGISEMYHVGDAVYQHSGLAASRACKYQQRTIDVEDSFLLHWVHSAEKSFKCFLFQCIDIVHQYTSVI